MKQVSKLLMMFLIAIIISGCSSNPYTYEHYQDKIDKKEININVLGGSLNPSYAEMNLKIEYTGDDKFEFVIPAGTLFTSTDNNTQNMISAHAVIVSFPGESPNQIQNVAIESFCINYFLDPPTLNPSLPSDYSNNLMDIRYSTVVSGDAIWRLNECLEQKSDSHSVKQMAIWMVSDGLLDLSREEVAAKVEEHFFAPIKNVLFDRFRDQLIGEEFKNLSDDDLVKKIEEIMPPDSLIAQGLNPDDLHPERAARKEVEAFFESAGKSLKDCGIDINSKRFFQN